MTGEVYAKAEDRPSAVERAFRFVAFGASHYNVVAPAATPCSVTMAR